MTIIKKYPFGEAIEEFKGIRYWTAFKHRWFRNAFGTKEDWVGLNDTSLMTAQNEGCTMVRFRLFNPDTKKIIRQLETNIERFNTDGHHHLNKKDLKATVHLPIRTLDRV